MVLCAEMETQQPYLQQFDSWGERVDLLHTTPAWRAQHVVSAEEGLIARGYERDHGAKNRIIQFAKLLLYSPSSGMYQCPLAMTDGATRLCALLLDSSVKLSSVSAPLDAQTRAVVSNAYAHLTSRDGKQFWTSGQWMTERGGGSDVGDGTRTIARLQPDGSYKLYGFKCQCQVSPQSLLPRVESASVRALTRSCLCWFAFSPLVLLQGSLRPPTPR